ncbi:hypothetical protein [Desulfopila sp. IMCC35008]|uniref:hypothetical protein n=1 Tax=Desulfopila sp. IMCC35008 TaxID=2653858 RepID=UPI0013D4D388|nr:hypothetical protein [Desulfopila sp. IMCC35008]
MSQLTEIIVYLWLIPVAFQIVLPLAVHALWLVGRLPFQLMRRSTSKLGETSTAAA